MDLDSLDSLIVLLQPIFVVLVFFLGFRDPNLRWLGFILFLIYWGMAPWVELIRGYSNSTDGMGWVSISLLAFICWAMSRLVLLRVYYAASLAQSANKFFSLRFFRLLVPDYLRLLCAWVFPADYEERRYRQEYQLATVQIWFMWCNLVSLLTYPVIYFLPNCVFKEACNLQQQYADLQALAESTDFWLRLQGQITLIADHVYMTLFGENKLLLWELNQPVQYFLTLFEFYILFSLAFQAFFGMFTRNRLQA